MSAVLSAPYSAKKPIEALFAEICELVAILRETRAALALIQSFPSTLGATPAEIIELHLREDNCRLMLRGLREAAIYELANVEESA